MTSLFFLWSEVKLRVRLFGNALALTFISERRQNNQGEGLLSWQLRSVVHVWVKQEKCQSQWQLPPITKSRTWRQHPLGHQHQNHANITMLFTFLSPPMLTDTCSCEACLDRTCVTSRRKDNPGQGRAPSATRGDYWFCCLLVSRAFWPLLLADESPLWQWKILAVNRPKGSHSHQQGS